MGSFDKEVSEENLGAMIFSRVKIEDSFKGIVEIVGLDTTNTEWRVAKVIDYLNSRAKSIKKIVVNQEIVIDANKDAHKIELRKCEFNGKVRFKGTFEYDVIIVQCTFNESMNINRCVFLQSVSIHSSNFTRFHHVIETRFESEVDYFNTRFEREQFYYKTVFDGRSLFRRTHFSGSLSFIDCQIRTNTSFDFSEVELCEWINLTSSGFPEGVNYWGIKMADFDYAKIQKRAPVLGMHGELPSYAELRESLRMIKNSFLKQGNRIEALEFHRREMNMYRLELKASKGRQEEKILLLLNRLSNSYGLSWVRGVAFTMLVTCIFYCIFLVFAEGDLQLTFQLVDFKRNIEDFFKLLNITNWDFTPLGEPRQWWSYPLLLISRFFIGYGYYQTIQAFRKYGKN